MLAKFEVLSKDMLAGAFGARVTLFEFLKLLTFPKEPTA
jgi:hypothetical protein